MGNNQSLETPRKFSQKLSKSRTGNHNPNAPSSPYGQSSSSSARFPSLRLSSRQLPADGSSPVTATPPAPASPECPTGQKPDRRASVVSMQTKVSRRLSLFRSKSQGPKADTRDTGSAHSQDEPHRRGRSNSLAFHHPAAPTRYRTDHDRPPAPPRSHMSLHYDLSSYQAKRLLNLLEADAPAQMAAAQEDIRVTETTWKCSNPADQADSADQPGPTISRANSDLSLYTPVRRRSIIMTPGVATRAQSIRDMPRSGPSFRLSHPSTPNRSRPPSSESRRGSAPPMPVLVMPPRNFDPVSIPRVVTPCEAEYQSIGAFKLGSLRITNGSASPASPAPDRLRPAQNAKASKLASQRADQNPGNSLAEIASEESGAAAVQVTGQSHESPQCTTTVQAPRPHPAVSNATASPAPGVVVKSAWLGQDGSQAAPSMDLANSPPNMLPEIHISPFSVSLRSSQPPSPRPASPRLQTTSKLTAEQDLLFDDVPEQLEYSPEVLDIRMDASAKSEPLEVASSSNKTKTSIVVSRSDSGFVSATSPASECPSKSLSKADSGYSSNVSLRSFQAKTKRQSAGRELALSLELQALRCSSGKDQEVVDVRRDTVRLNSQGSTTVAKRLSLDFAAAPPVPLPRDLEAKAPEARIVGATAVTPKATKKFRHSLSPLSSLDSRESSPLSPVGSACSSATTVSGKSNTAGSLSGSLGNGLRLLLGGSRAPLSSPPYTASPKSLVPEEAAPLSSTPVYGKLRSRPRQSMFAPMSAKKLFLKQHASRDTMTTIFSVGSIETDPEQTTAAMHAMSTDNRDGSSDNNNSGNNNNNKVLPEVGELSSARAVPLSTLDRRVSLKPIPIEKDHAPIETKRDVTAAPDEARHTSPNANNRIVDTSAFAASLMAAPSNRPSPPAGLKAGRPMGLNVSVEQTLSRRLANSDLVADSAESNNASPTISIPMSTRNAPATTRAHLGPPILKNQPAKSFASSLPLRPRASAPSLNRGLNHASSRSSLRSDPSLGQPVSRRASGGVMYNPPAIRHEQGPVRASPRGTPPVPAVNHQGVVPVIPSHKPSSATGRVVVPPSQTPSPNWAVKADHDVSRRPSMASAWNGRDMRHAAFSSAREGSGGVVMYGPGPPPTCSPQIRESIQRQERRWRLRHRASYDVYDESLAQKQPQGQQSQESQQQRQRPGSGPRNGSIALTSSNPWNPWDDAAAGDNFDPMAGQWDQLGPYPPHALEDGSAGGSPALGQQLRSWSSGNLTELGRRCDRDGFLPAQLPHRVLHSYNLPAYRNVQIWK